jgi:hypothetical protein
LLATSWVATVVGFTDAVAPMLGVAPMPIDADMIAIAGSDRSPLRVNTNFCASGCLDSVEDRRATSDADPTCSR